MHTLVGYRVWRLDCSSSVSAYHNTAIRYEQRLEMARGPAKGGGRRYPNPHLKLGAVRSTRAVGTITRSRPLTAIVTVRKRAAEPILNIQNGEG